MAYKIIDIEGVGEAYAPKLIAAGISKVEQLLEKGATPKGRAALAEATGISEKLILKWTNVAENLVGKMQETNDAKHLVRRVPSVKELVKMIEQAKALKPVMTY